MENFVGGRLHVAEVVADGTPRRWALVLHGILGAGNNLRTFARRLAGAAPDWGFALVDLRMHGQSQGFTPPHTVAAAAADLDQLDERLSGSIAGVIGHSFGGKVALAYVERRRARLEHVVLLDANPGARDAARLGASRTIAVLASLPPTFSSRAAFVEDALARGITPAEAEWLATNVRADGDVFRFRLDLEAMRAMIDDYAALDLWGVVESRGEVRFATSKAVAPTPTFDLVIGGASDAFTPADRARARADAEQNPAVRTTVIEGAGHWLHVEALDAVVATTLEALGGPR